MFKQLITRLTGRRSTAGPDTKCTQRDIYAFDQFTANALDPAIPFYPGSDNLPHVYIFRQDPLHKGFVTSRDWIGLSLTLSKIIELGVLHFLGAGSLWWATGLIWFYFFTSAVVLQFMELSWGYFDVVGKDDVLAGGFPSMRRPAGPCKILLGIPGNYRHHILWKVVWVFGIPVCGTGLVLCYVLLNSCTAKLVCVWLVFQILWLFCRSIFYHVALNRSRDEYHTQNMFNWEQLSYPLKMRVLDLLVALSKYQMHVHPRGSYSYREDVNSVENACDVLTRCILLFEFPLDNIPRISTGGTLNVSIHAVMGDTFLSSVAWFCGSKCTPMDLYDCCIIFLEISDHARPTTEKPRPLAVPAVRVLGYRNPRNFSPSDIDDVESRRQNSPEMDIPFSTSKGSHNRGIQDMAWYFFIPCQGNMWIQLGLIPMKVLTSTTGKFMTGEDVTAKLQSGDWGVSLENVEMVRDALLTSRLVTDMVVDLFGTKLGVTVDRRPLS